MKRQRMLPFFLHKEKADSVSVSHVYLYLTAAVCPGLLSLTGPSGFGIVDQIFQIGIGIVAFQHNFSS